MIKYLVYCIVIIYFISIDVDMELFTPIILMWILAELILLKNHLTKNKK